VILGCQLKSKSYYMNMTYHVIYDGNCNFCVTLVQVLETLDKGKIFRYTPMQEAEILAQWGIAPEDCEQGMILIDANAPDRRWQGSDAAEEIGKLLPFGSIFVDAYRTLPGFKWAGDKVYEQVRDNRYTLFGQRSSTYTSTHCPEDNFNT
jgi:predicted DCC family thiol-disulfide oxidoreductase YuxK